MRIIKVLLLAVLLAVLGIGLLYVAAPAGFVQLAVAVERWVGRLHHREIDISGFHLHYLDSDGPGETLLLVHGFGGDKDNWTRIARHLSGRYRVVAPDLPGYGESDSPMDARYGIADEVERLHAFVGALGLTRIHLGGNSMGGNIAAVYAARYPNEVGSLWLIANSGLSTAPVSELRKSIAETGQNRLIPSTPEQFREMLGFVMSRPPPVPDPVIDVLAARAIKAHDLRQKQFEDLMTEASALEPLIAGLPIPTHILWGEQDRALHVGGADVLLALLPQASKTVMPGIGHVPMLEAPEAAALDYIAFRQTLMP